MNSDVDSDLIHALFILCCLVIYNFFFPHFKLRKKLGSHRSGPIFGIVVVFSLFVRRSFLLLISISHNGTIVEARWNESIPSPPGMPSVFMEVF